MLSALEADSEGLRQLAGRVNGHTAAAQQGTDPVSDPGVYSTKSGASGANYEAPAGNSIGATSGGIGAASVAPDANLGSGEQGIGQQGSAQQGSAQQGSAQHARPAQQLHGSVGHQATAGIVTTESNSG